MKSKVISVPILSITLILVSLILVSSFGLSRPKQNSAWITFSGDLYGEQEVIGCCPNAGPNPEYNMTLSEVFPWLEAPETYNGHLFMNVFRDLSEHGRGKKKTYYIVQFWWTNDNDNDYYFIEIIGGDIEWDKKAKVLTVTFEKVPCEIWIDNILTATVPVNFNLTRAQVYYN